VGLGQRYILSEYLLCVHISMSLYDDAEDYLFI
jgi:hypothetical protein